MPIAYIQRTRERYAEYPPFKWITNHEAPWTVLTKPLTACRLALISSGGFYTKEQASFTENDSSYRLISKSTAAQDLRIYHHAYRDDDPDRDPNCVFPLDRLRELEAANVIGGLADDAISFVTSYSASRDIERAAKIVVELRRMAVDAVLLVPV